MDNEVTVSEHLKTPADSQTKAQVVIIAVATALAAALVGVASYVYFLRKIANSPKGILSKCREAIKQIERELDFAGRA